VKPLMLDISRLVSRAEQGALTGIDRVELAYFQKFLSLDRPVFFLCRLPKSYAVLDHAGGQVIYDRVTGAVPWGPPGLARMLARRHGLAGQRAIADVWRLAKVVVADYRLSHCYKAIFSDDMTYFNVGHSNLRQGVFDAVATHKESRIIVLIHDVIPLDYPQFSRTEVTDRFRADMQRVSARADLVIYNSRATQDAARVWFDRFGRQPPDVVAHLGCDIGNAPQVFEKASEKPSFCVIGTIEPRKNHALLLKIWQEFVRNLPPAQIPPLHIIGKRGWENMSVFKILDSDPMMGQHVFEHPDMDDQTLSRHLTQSWGLLFPSHVEGFGLPLIEAARAGIPILCGENAIYREILGDYPLYLDVDNFYLWAQRILERAGRIRESEADRQVRGRSVNLPDWNGHFDQIFRFV